MVATKIDAKTGAALGTGRRKSSVARVRIKAGSGKVTVNGRDLQDYFPNIRDQNAILDTLAASRNAGSVDVQIHVEGGGMTGQSGACRMGVARALISYNGENFEPMRDGSFLTRDARMKERKKPGLHGARRGTQFSKR
ncbi:MAG TPA: 30S ribosomal protein S9 [Pirellulaceae bacterium]|nr:30S ribosomal protein S9 [Pirellulaceae bacterium]HMO91590.1 30S ribosomal protein S9 [Pirellulaceae bacterium]HMP68287.1 30S ribosomal protein S9 [Pirellulaceae bacterium]